MAAARPLDSRAQQENFRREGNVSSKNAKQDNRNFQKNQTPNTTERESLNLLQSADADRRSTRKVEGRP